MSLFGSRQDDPLLQDDPFAPSPNRDDPSPDSASDSDADPAPPERTDSVFSRPSTSSRGDGTARHRVMHRSAATAKEGRLHELNAAFDAGWRLDHVELQSDAPDAQEADAPPTDSSLTIAFVLHRLD